MQKSITVLQQVGTQTPYTTFAEQQLALRMLNFYGYGELVDTLRTETHGEGTCKLV